MQVLQEFFVTVTRKVAEPLTVDEAVNRVRELCTWNVGQLSFWDAGVIHGAAELGCDLLWTEDLHHGQSIRGGRIRSRSRLPTPLRRELPRS